MKRVFTAIFILAALVLNLNAQKDSVLFSDDFESYTVGGYVAQQGDPNWWTTWSGNPGSSEDALVSDAQNHTTGGSKSAHTQGSTTDLVLKLGNQISGVYVVEFYYLIPTGKGGYFNIQHTENMGQEWAFECFFGNNGNGYLSADGQQINFTHPNGDWTHVKFKADLDKDSAYLWIQDNLVFQWVFSHQADGSNGTKQLGAVDFYAGAPTGQTPEWYLDDVSYTLLQAGAEPPELTLNNDSLIVSNGAPYLLTISNEGGLPLEYDLYIRYEQPGSKLLATNTNTLNQLNVAKKVVNLGQVSKSVQKLDEPIKVNLPKDVTLTHLQGDVTQNLGFNSQVDAQAAALFKSDVMKDYVGMTLSNLIIYVGNLPVSGSTYAKVWLKRKYTTPGPLEEVESQAFTPSGENSQNLINLDSAVFINGDDLWFGWAFTDPGANTYPLAMDGGPLVDDGNWLKYGPSWSEETNPSFGNYGIIGTLTGDTIFRHIYAKYATAGSIDTGQSLNVPITFDVTGLQEGDTVKATLVLRTNDPDDNEDFVEIPVVLAIAPANVENNANPFVQVYPNPAVSFINILSSNTIDKVEIYSLDGKLVNVSNPNASFAKVNLNTLDKGVYLIKVYSGEQIQIQKIIVQ